MNNWYKRADTTEHLDEDLIGEIGTLTKDIPEELSPRHLPSLDPYSTWISNDDLQFFIDAVAKDRMGILLTPKQHEWLRKRIERQKREGTFKTRPLRQTIDEALDDLEQSVTDADMGLSAHPAEQQEYEQMDSI